VSGERVIPKRIVAERLSEIDRLPPFGIEAFMNERIIKERLRIAVVRLENVIIPAKWRRWAAGEECWRTGRRRAIYLR
jgi:hypothetical protein